MLLLGLTVLPLQVQPSRPAQGAGAGLEPVRGRAASSMTTSRATAALPPLTARCVRNPEAGKDNDSQEPLPLK